MLDVLRKLREDKGFTQMELAEKTGVSQKTISALEVGRIKNMTYQTAVRLGKALKCKPEVLLGVKPEKKPTSKLAELAQKFEE
jgi:transcriptional regulator with XRE-family HTH domain